MQAAQDALHGARVVVLDEFEPHANGILEGFLVVAFVEKATRIPEHLGFDEYDVGDGKWGGFHQ